MNTQVAKNFVITLDYHVTDPDGEVVDEGREPLIYLHGGYDDIFPLIEELISNLDLPRTYIIHGLGGLKEAKYAPAQLLFLFKKPP